MTIVVVHGGVSGRPKRVHPLDRASAAGQAYGRALDAVEQAVRVLEDDPALNAGTGSVLNARGELELDAGIMDGATGRAGGVANVSVRNPVVLARRVLEGTPHVLVTGEGARALGADLEHIQPTAEQLARFERARAEGLLDPARFGDPEHVDTVGAVALGDDGDLAAASSTGGVFGKLPGRVGDAPIPGAGLYAGGVAAVVGTGVGELFLRTSACLRVALLIAGGAVPQEACERIIALLGALGPYPAGLLALSRAGQVGAAYRGATWPVACSSLPLAPVRLS